MTLSDLTSKIEPLFNEMKAITLAAGVPESQYEKIREIDPENISLEEMSDRLRFLQAVRAEQYQGVVVIWRLLKPEVWDRYLTMGETNLREQRLLREARRKLKRIWKDKYGTQPTAVEEVPAGDDAGEPVRPEGRFSSRRRR